MMKTILSVALLILGSVVGAQPANPSVDPDVKPGLVDVEFAKEAEVAVK